MTPTLDVESYSDDVIVPWFGPRMVCTVCGAIDADARPNWNERARFAYSDDRGFRYIFPLLFGLTGKVDRTSASRREKTQQLWLEFWSDGHH